MNLSESVIDGLQIETTIRCVAVPFEKLMTSQEACAFLGEFTVAENAFVELNLLGIGAAGIADWLNVDTHLFRQYGCRIEVAVVFRVQLVRLRLGLGSCPD